MRAHQRRDVGGVGDIEAGFALLAQAAAARVAPDHHGQPGVAGVLGQLAQLFLHVELLVRAGIERVADPRAAQPQGVFHAAGQRLIGGERVAVRAVDLEDQRDLPGKVRGPGGEQADRRCKGTQPGVDRQLPVIQRVVARRVRANDRAGPCSKP